MNSATMLGKTCGHPATAMASTRRPCPAPAPVAFVPKASFAHQVTSISQRRTEIATRAAPASQASAAATTPVNPYEGKVRQPV